MNKEFHSKLRTNDYFYLIDDMYNNVPYVKILNKSNRKAMNRNWSNQNANPALKTKAGNK